MARQRTESLESQENPGEEMQSSISRRALLAGTAAIAVGASATSAIAAGGGGGHGHHGHHAQGKGSHEALVRAAGDCLIAGELCDAHCQAVLASGDSTLAACSAVVRDMSAGCSALIRLAAAGSRRLPEMAKTCSLLLEDCKAECDKHPEHEECKACSKACEACLKACEGVLA